MNTKLSFTVKLLKIDRKNTQGFSLMEVMIGMLVMASFIGVAMQTLVAATAIKVKAQDRSEATAWIQSDLEIVRYRANQLPANTALCSATSNTSGYADALRDDVVADTSNSNSTTTTVTVTSPTPQSTTTTTISKAGDSSVRSYTGTRTISFRSPSVMTVSYTVTPSGDTKVLANLYTEVIPDKALQCS
jgi:prepilin-type N-terminal cleavage/methylation domain-containing protein